MEGGLVVHVPGPRRAGAVEIDTLAREAGLHPDVVRGLVALGLLEPAPFPRDAAARLARAGGLRRDLGLNYAGAVLACELLARIDESSPACDERHLDD